MTKVILAGASVAALAFAVPAMAQNAGNGPTSAAATPAGCPVGVNNCSLVEQAGEENDATVDQTGSDNVADVSQTGTFAAPGNLVTVDQTGTENFAFVNQDTSATNTARVRATVIQDGVNSLADIDQVGNEAGGTATVAQNALTDFSFATVEQTGAAGGGANTATIVQTDGFLNDAAIVQGRTTVFTDTIRGIAPGTVTDSDGGVATIDQIGDLNVGSVVQGGTDQFADVDQNSSGGAAFGNFALVVQGSGALSADNDALVNQQGDDNFSEIYQNDQAAGGNNLADVDQFGSDGNFSRITQNGSDHQAFVTQYDGSSSFVTQSGTGSLATVTQGTP